MWLKFFAILRKYLPLFVLLDIGFALLIGYNYPQAVKTLKPWVVVPLFFMLYPMMINFKIEHAVKAFRNPKVVLAALIINFVISPPLAALFAYVFFPHGDPYLIAGFILKVTVAGSGMVAAWTGFANGRVETALIIVAAGLLLVIVAVPFWMVVLVGQSVPVDVWAMIKQLAYIVILPLLAGILTRRFILQRYGVPTYKKIQPVLPAISSLGMYVIIFVAIGMQAANIINHPEIILMLIPAIAGLYSLLFVITIIYAKTAKLHYGDAIAMGYSTTAKNHSITLALSITAFGGLATLPAAFAPIVQIPLMIIILRLSPWLQRSVFPEKHLADTAVSTDAQALHHQ